MKRFYVALCIIILVISSSLFFNFKVQVKSKELIELTYLNNNYSVIEEWWNKNEIWFELLLADEQNSSIKLNILKLKSQPQNLLIKENIRTEAQKIMDSTKLSVKNIF